MAKVLYIEASPRKERSYSIQAAKFFLEEYKKKCPKDDIVMIDLWKKDLPPFDGEIIHAKYAILHQKKTTSEEEKQWKRVEQIIEEFKSADKYVISTPMWNYALPYRLKHYIDILVQPTYTFSFSPEKGYDGLVKGKPAVGIYARGGEYQPNDKADFQRTYLEHMLKFIGFTEIYAVIAEPTLVDAERAKEKAKKQVLNIIQKF